MNAFFVTALAGLVMFGALGVRPALADDGAVILISHDRHLVAEQEG